MDTNLMEDEESDGFETIWFSDVDSAISTLESTHSISTKYTGIYEIEFQTKRELTFLREAKKLLADMI